MEPIDDDKEARDRALFLIVQLLVQAMCGSGLISAAFVAGALREARRYAEASGVVQNPAELKYRLLLEQLERSIAQA